MYSIENLIQQGLDHSLIDHNLLFIGFCGSVEFDDVPKVVFRIVDEQPNFSIRMREKNALEVDHVRVLEFTEQLR